MLVWIVGQTVLFKSSRKASGRLKWQVQDAEAVLVKLIASSRGFFFFADFVKLSSLKPLVTPCFRSGLCHPAFKFI